jgi:hypothetical protein
LTAKVTTRKESNYMARNRKTLPSVVNEDFATRMAVLKQLSARTGIRLPETIIPEGESLIPYGEDRQRQLKEDIYALPTVAEAALDLAAIRREQAPQDVTVPLKGLIMSPTNGGLYGSNGTLLGSPERAEFEANALGYSEAAFQMASWFIKPGNVHAGFAQTLLSLPPEIRAVAFNYFADSANEKKQVVLRTLMAPQKKGDAIELRRTISAVVGSRYVGIEDHDLVADLDSALPAGARARYTFDEHRSDIEIFWPAMTRQLKVGDIALIALHAINSQTTMHAIHLVPKLLRVLCLNFTTAWGMGDEEIVSIKHIGEARAKFKEAVKRALAAVEPFILCFGDAYANKLPAARGVVVEKVVKAFMLPQKFGAEVIGSWDADGEMSAGDTLAGLTHAMTRASQTHSMGQATAIEQAAGKLVRNGWAEIGLN